MNLRFAGETTLGAMPSQHLDVQEEVKPIKQHDDACARWVMIGP
ncbi:MAG TPA: hypothetical protein VH639_01770 [Bryobacteraceae bacterium]